MTAPANNDRPAETPKPPDEFVDIPGFVGIYQASRSGQIRSLTRVVPHTYGWKYSAKTRTIHGQMLTRPSIGKDGYLRANLYANSKRRCFLWHRVIALAFLGPPRGDKIEVNHKDGNRVNNSIDNLEYVTRSENAFHAFRVLGRQSPRGEKNRKAKMRPGRVVLMRKMRCEGKTFAFLGRKFGVSANAAKAICNRKNWSHVA